MSVYRIHFTWKEKQVVLSAKSLDMTHPYFVSIKDIILPDKNNLIINPADDGIRKDFGESDHIMIPFQTVILIEEMSEERHKKLKNLSLVKKDKETE